MPTSTPINPFLSGNRQLPGGCKVASLQSVEVDAACHALTLGITSTNRQLLLWNHKSLQADVPDPKYESGVLPHRKYGMFALASLRLNLWPLAMSVVRDGFLDSKQKKKVGNFRANKIAPNFAPILGAGLHNNRRLQRKISQTESGFETLRLTQK